MKGWKQFIEPFLISPSGVFEAFEKLWMAMGAPEIMALFARTGADQAKEIWLLTPEAAAALSEKLPGNWTDTADPVEFGWSLMIGHAGSHEKFGLRAPSDM